MAGSIFRRRYFFLLFGAGLRVLNYGKTVRPAQLIIEFPQDAQRGPFNVPEFTVTVEIGAVKFYVRMNMGLVHMGGYDKLVLAPGKLHCQFIADPVGFFRADLSRLEGLNHTVHDNVMIRGLTAPGDLMVELLADLKFFCGGFRKSILSRGILIFCGATPYFHLQDVLEKRGDRCLLASGPPFF